MAPRTHWDRIAMVLPLLSSNQHGEVVNAAAAIGKILKSEGMDWHALAKRITAPPKADDAPWEEPKPNGEPPKWAREEPKHRWQGETPRPETGPRRKPSAWKQDTEDVRKAYERAQDHPSKMDAWSLDFLASIHEQVIDNGRTLSDRQRSKLDEILDKLGL